MASFLLSRLQNYFYPSLLTKASELAGISNEQVQRVFNKMFPVLVEGLQTKLSQTRGSEDILEMIRASRLDERPFTEPSVIFDGGEKTRIYQTMGQNFLNTIYNNDPEAILQQLVMDTEVPYNGISMLSALSTLLILNALSEGLAPNKLDKSGLESILTESSVGLPASASQTPQNGQSNWGKFLIILLLLVSLGGIAIWQQLIKQGNTTTPQKEVNNQKPSQEDPKIK